MRLAAHSVRHSREGRLVAAVTLGLLLLLLVGRAPSGFAADITGTITPGGSLIRRESGPALQLMTRSGRLGRRNHQVMPLRVLLVAGTRSSTPLAHSSRWEFDRTTRCSGDSLPSIQLKAVP